MVNEEAGTRTGEGLQDREDVRRLARTLTDDRQDPDLLVFEKTWGHRLLAGLSVGMLVAALVFVVFCAWNLYGLASSLGVPVRSVAPVSASTTTLGFCGKVYGVPSTNSQPAGAEPVLMSVASAA